jgi:hypothetical protein
MVYNLKAPAILAHSRHARQNSCKGDCDSDGRGSKAGRGRKEKGNHEDREDLKGASAFAFHASGEDFFEVFEVFVFRFFCLCLNRGIKISPVDKVFT